MATRMEGQLARCADVFVQQMTGSNNQQAAVLHAVRGPGGGHLGQMSGFYHGGGLFGLRNVQAAAQASGTTYLLGMAKVWEGFAMGTATSIWGDLPYSEAVSTIPEAGAGSATEHLCGSADALGRRDCGHCRRHAPRSPTLPRTASPRQAT